MFYQNSSIGLIFNRDGAVDDVDLEIIEGTLGLSDGEQGFNWRCDLNYDKKVDMRISQYFLNSSARISLRIIIFDDR